MAITNFANAVMTDTPIGYWRLGELTDPSGGPWITKDASGKGNDGNVIGGFPEITFQQPGSHGVLIRGPVGDTAALFDGKTGRIIVLNSGSLNSNYFTIEAIVRWDGPNPGPTQYQQRILEKSSYPGVAQYSLQIFPDGHIQAEFRISGDGAGTPLKTVNPEVTQGVWTHIVATYDGNHIQIYVNGVPKDKISKSGPLDQKTPTPANLIESGVGIGNETQRDRPFHGLIDEVALYATALSGPRILAHYQSNFVTIHPPKP
jgi:hypothetical protein